MAEATVAGLGRLDTTSSPSPNAGSCASFRMFRMLGDIPSEYMQYFLFHDEVLTEQGGGRTRAEEVMAFLPDVLTSYPGRPTTDPRAFHGPRE